MAKNNLNSFRIYDTIRDKILELLKDGVLDSEFKAMS